MNDTDKNAPARLGANPARPRGTDSARIIMLIETVALIGAGTEADPVRLLHQYWNTQGELIAQTDPVIDKRCKYSAIENTCRY